MPRPRFSVIIPVLHEADTVAETVAHVLSLPASGGVEVVVVDGAPEADTLAALREAGPWPDVLAVASPPGRARQMNLGALASHGETLVFLHADTVLPFDAFAAMRTALLDTPAVGGAFDLDFGPDATPGQRWIARRANARSRRTRVPYGDQAQFLDRGVFFTLGGFARIPLMEDLELFTRLRDAGRPVAILPGPVVTSPRRWREEGTVYCTARNLCLRALYHAGVPPRFLAPFYRFSRRGGGPRA